MRQKTHVDNARFQSLFERPEASRMHIRRKAAQTYAQVEQRLAALGTDQRYGLAWSGGKESLLLYSILAQHGHGNIPGVLALCPSPLERPRFEAWCLTHKPPQIEIRRSGQDLDWLRAHPEYVFPERPAQSHYIRQWALIKQRRVQQKYCKEKGISFWLTGRRRADGNFCGRSGDQSSSGVQVYDPLWNWSDAETLAALNYCEIELPPIYAEPCGWINGSKHWPLLRASQLGCVPWAYLFRHDGELWDVPSFIEFCRETLHG